MFMVGGLKSWARAVSGSVLPNRMTLWPKGNYIHCLRTNLIQRKWWNIINLIMLLLWRKFTLFVTFYNVGRQTEITEFNFVVLEENVRWLQVSSALVLIYLNVSIPRRVCNLLIVSSARIPVHHKHVNLSEMSHGEWLPSNVEIPPTPQPSWTCGLRTQAWTRTTEDMLSYDSRNIIRSPTATETSVPSLPAVVLKTFSGGDKMSPRVASQTSIIRSTCSNLTLRHSAS